MKAQSTNTDLGRRRFTQCAAASAFAVAIAACGSSSDDGSLDGSEGSEAGDGSSSGVDSNSGGPTTSPSTTGGDPGAPVWMTVPAIQFVQGVASEVSVAEYVSDPDGDALTLMLNDVELPAGVTFDADGMKFVYDGSGSVAMTDGHVLTADDGTA